MDLTLTLQRTGKLLSLQVQRPWQIESCEEMRRAARPRSYPSKRASEHTNENGYEVLIPFSLTKAAHYCLAEHVIQLATPRFCWRWETMKVCQACFVFSPGINWTGSLVVLQATHTHSPAGRFIHAGLWCECLGTERRSDEHGARAAHKNSS